MATSFLASGVSALVINEIMYDPSASQGSDSYNEWIEIYNDEESDIDLEGFTLCGMNLMEGYVEYPDEDVENEGGWVLEEGKYALITDGGSGTEVYDNFDVDVDALALHVSVSEMCGGLINSGNTITLENDGGNIIDEVTYEDDAGSGYSLELVGGDFMESEDEGGTPGGENSEEDSDDTNGDNNDQDDADEDDNDQDDSGGEGSDSDDSLEEPDLNPIIEITNEKIVLNSPVEKIEEEKKSGNFISDKEKLRRWVIYSFLIFAVLLIILLALRRL